MRRTHNRTTLGRETSCNPQMVNLWIGNFGHMLTYGWSTLADAGELVLGGGPPPQALGTLGGPFEAAPGKPPPEHDRRQEPQLRFLLYCSQA